MLAKHKGLGVIAGMSLSSSELTWNLAVRSEMLSSLAICCLPRSFPD
jgi:hypothetical protein